MKLNQDLQYAATTLHNGGLVAIPTETVYGLAADAKNPAALLKVFQAKGRPVDHPLIVHIADISQLTEWAIDISPQALSLAKHCWPGPLTLILKKAPGVNDIVTGGQDTIGIRVPNHPVALALLQQFGSGVAAPSANRFGRISPTTAEAVREELGDKVDCILDGGQCDVGVESTIVDVSGNDIRILRPGMITAKQIEAVLHAHLAVTSTQHTPRVSGSLESHYAPVTKTELMSSQQLQKYLQNIPASDLPLAVMHFKNISVTEKIHSVLMQEDAAQYAHDLYKVLRDLDKKQFKKIIIQAVPDDSGWDAVRDRLSRATY